MQPNARAILIREKTAGADPLVDAILTNPDGPEAVLYTKAQALIRSPIKKQYLEASILATNDLGSIATLTEMDEALIRMYRDIYFDVQSYDKLSKLELLGMSSTEDEKMMKIWAMSQGLNFLSWRLGKAVAINPIEGLKDLFTTCVYKSKEAIFTGNASESSKEATKWTKLSMDLARLLKAWVLDGDAAKQDIELALKEISPNFDGFDDLLVTEDPAEGTAEDGVPTFEADIGSLQDIL